jgi:hypothetical protein
MAGPSRKSDTTQDIAPRERLAKAGQAASDDAKLVRNMTQIPMTMTNADLLLSACKICITDGEIPIER